MRSRLRSFPPAGQRGENSHFSNISGRHWERLENYPRIHLSPFTPSYCFSRDFLATVILCRLPRTLFLLPPLLRPLRLFIYFRRVVLRRPFSRVFPLLPFFPIIFSSFSTSFVYIIERNTIYKTYIFLEPAIS